MTSSASSAVPAGIPAEDDALVGWRVRMRDVKTAGRVVRVVSSAVQLFTVPKVSKKQKDAAAEGAPVKPVIPKLSTVVDVGPDFGAVRALVEGVSVYFTLISPEGEKVASGWVSEGRKYALEPTPSQERALRSHTGGSRSAYNLLLGEINERMGRARLDVERYVCMGADESDAWSTANATHGVVFSFEGLRKLWNSVKGDLAPWWDRNSKEAYGHGIESLSRAFTNFFASCTGDRAGKAMGWPRFQTRSKHQKFAYTTGAFRFVDDRHVQLPMIGVVALAERAKTLVADITADRTQVTRFTIRCRAGRWYLSAQLQTRRVCGVSARPNHHRQIDAVAGVDLGVNHLATVATSDGQIVKIDNPRAMRRYQTRLGELQRRYARQEAGSNRRARTAKQIARLHARIADIRANAQHELSTWLARTFTGIVLEDLNAAGMSAAPAPRPDPDRVGAFLPNGSAAKAGLNRANLDVGYGEIRRQTTYKAVWNGAHLYIHPRYQASTGVCQCGCRRSRYPAGLRSGNPAVGSVMF